MNILLLYPASPDTFWSYKHALRFVGKRATFPPLGLLTVSSLLPAAWERRLVDLNVSRLKEQDLAWADCAYISGMAIQKASALELIARCRRAGLTIVGGGPLFTMDHASFDAVDHFVLNEAEITLPRFLADLAAGCPQRLYETADFADITRTPVPDWSLIDLKPYYSMGIQYSRGCPFNCDFCNITSLLGRHVRTKSTAQIIAELDQLYACGWRGGVFFVDDNFIGNKAHLKADLLPALVAWRQHKGRSAIRFHTEASINLADDTVLMAQMAAAGFDTVFVGIETPEESGLAECSKQQNTGRDLVADVKRIQRAGLQVQGGFIVGFDCDQPTVFRRQIEFIQSSGIVTAMVGLLQAPQGTRLYARMQAAGRLLGTASGDNVEGTTNIVPVMDREQLMAGYREILHHIYAPRHYYRRVRIFLKAYRAPRLRAKASRAELLALWRSFYRLGILGRERVQYWKLLIWTVIHRPASLHMAVVLAISGYHFRKVCELHVLDSAPHG